MIKLQTQMQAHTHLKLVSILACFSFFTDFIERISVITENKNCLLQDKNFKNKIMYFVWIFIWKVLGLNTTKV